MSTVHFGVGNSQTCILEVSEISELIIYVKHELSHLGRIRLSIKLIVKIVPPTGLTMKGKACFCCMVVILRECVWKTRMKGLNISTFISGAGLL